MDPTMFNAGSAGGRRLCIDSACKETSRCLFINTNKALQRCLWGPGISSVVWLLLLCPVAWRCELFSLFIYCDDFEPALKFHISYHLAMSHTKSNTKTRTKTNTKCFKDSAYAVFCVVLHCDQDIKHDIPMCQIKTSMQIQWNIQHPGYFLENGIPAAPPSQKKRVKTLSTLMEEVPPTSLVTYFSTLWTS